jgi:hypothetical protein
METMTYSKVKVYSITYFIIKKYNLTLLSTLYKEYLLNRISKTQFIFILLLCESYKKNNIHQSTILYKFIDNYIKYHNTKFFQKLIFE